MNTARQLYIWLMDAQVRQRLAQEIKKVRGSRSQRDFAKELGVSYAAVRSWEEAESVPGIENFLMIAAQLNMTCDQLLERIGATERKESSPPEPIECILNTIEGLSREELILLMQQALKQLGSN